MTKRNLKFTFYLLITICLTLGLSISLQTLLAEWTPPSGSAPGQNVPPPIYASSTTGQLIDSDLGISGDLAAFQITAKGDFFADGHTIYMGGADWSIAYSPTWPNFGIFYDEGSPDKIVLSADGGGAADTDFVLNGDKVGIGTTDPGQKLDVVGNMELNGALYTPATQAWSGNPGASWGKIQYHSNRWYIVADSNSNRIVQFRRDGTNTSYIDNNGKFIGAADTLDGVDSSQFIRSDANDSFTGQLTMSTQKALIASNYGYGVYGMYNSYRYQHVWSMGTAYNLLADGTTPGNLYGLAWSYPRAETPQAKAGLSHQLLLMHPSQCYQK